MLLRTVPPYTDVFLQKLWLWRAKVDLTKGFWNPARKSPGALDPAVFPFPSGCKIHYGQSRYEAKWCKFMKLVIYRTFDVFAATLPPPHVFSAPFSLW